MHLIRWTDTHSNKYYSACYNNNYSNLLEL